MAPMADPDRSASAMSSWVGHPMSRAVTIIDDGLIKMIDARLHAWSRYRRLPLADRHRAHRGAASTPDTTMIQSC